MLNNESLPTLSSGRNCCSRCRLRTPGLQIEMRVGVRLYFELVHVLPLRSS